METPYKMQFKISLNMLGIGSLIPEIDVKKFKKFEKTKRLLLSKTNARIVSVKKAIHVCVNIHFMICVINTMQGSRKDIKTCGT